jgi:hypothetical protein
MRIAGAVLACLMATAALVALRVLRATEAVGIRLRATGLPAAAILPEAAAAH